MPMLPDRRTMRLTKAGLWIAGIALLFYGTSFYTRDWRAIPAAQQRAEAALRPRVGQAGQALPDPRVRPQPESTGSVAPAAEPLPPAAASARAELAEPAEPAPIPRAEAAAAPLPQPEPAAALAPPAAEPAALAEPPPVEPQLSPEPASGTDVRPAAAAAAPKPRARHKRIRSERRADVGPASMRRRSAMQAREPIQFRLAERGN